MGRDITGIRTDKNLNLKPDDEVSFERVHVSPKISNDEIEADQESIADHNLKIDVNEEVQANQEDVPTVESTNVVDPSMVDFRSKIAAFKLKEKTSSVKPSPNASKSVKASESSREIGKDVTSIRTDEKLNVKPNEVTLERVHVAPKISNDEVESEQVSSPVDHNPKGEVEEVQEDKDVPIVTSTNIDPIVPDFGAEIAALPVDHNPKREVRKEVEEKQDVPTPKITNVDPRVSDFRAKIAAFKKTEKKLSVKPSPKAPASVADSESPRTITPKAQSQQVSFGKIASGISNNAAEDGIEIENSSSSPMAKKNVLHTPVTAETLQPHSPSMSRKPSQSHTNQRHHDEEDNYSMATSCWTSIRSTKFKPTVPVGPRFVCGERVARRQEYYKRLEEKQKAMEAERIAKEARIKEEEEAALKKLRKSMSYRANPVPSFYQEGPPPKTKLKKLPLTRAKSPNLTRTKSCNDAARPAQDEKKSCSRVTRHSVGSTSTASKNKDRSGTRYGSTPNKSRDTNAYKKVKTRNGQAKDTVIPHPSEVEQMNADTCVPTPEHVEQETED